MSQMSQTDPSRVAPITDTTSARSALPEGELLSALADGELGGGNVAVACSAYAATAESAARWHAYHLIGDVLRSDDLACQPRRENALLDAVRAQLASEPVLFTPSAAVLPIGVAPSLPDARRTRALESGVLARWGIVPSAMAAGFALVAAGLLTVRLLSPTPTAASDSLQARATTSAAPADIERVAALPAPAKVASTTVEPPVLFADSTVVRDARVDRYLAAHQQFAGTSALAVPSGFLRNVTVDAPR